MLSLTQSWRARWSVDHHVNSRISYRVLSAWCLFLGLIVYSTCTKLALQAYTCLCYFPYLKRSLKVICYLYARTCMRFVIVAIVVMKRREYKSISVFHWYTVGFRRWILNSSRLLISLTSMSWKAAWWTRQCIRFHATSHVYIHMCIYRDMVSIWWVANTGICLLPASFVHIYIYLYVWE